MPADPLWNFFAFFPLLLIVKLSALEGCWLEDGHERSREADKWNPLGPMWCYPSPSQCSFWTCASERLQEQQVQPKLTHTYGFNHVTREWTCLVVLLFFFFLSGCFLSVVHLNVSDSSFLHLYIWCVGLKTYSQCIRYDMIKETLKLYALWRVALNAETPEAPVEQYYSLVAAIIGFHRILFLH